jgi:DNA polymerase III delta prime subunit
MPHFNMLITGRTGCGKTEYLLKILEEDYYKQFDYIVIICETFYLNKAFLNWKYIDDPDVIILVPEEEGEIEDFITLTYSDLAGTDSLIIFDDCASTDIAEKQRSQFTKAAQTGRQRGLSMIFITQQLTAVTKRYRSQVTICVLFKAG